jgi:hypothetical protein
MVQDQCDAFARNRSHHTGQKGCHTQCGSGFHHDTQRLPQPALGRADGAIVQQQGVGDQALTDLPGNRTDAPGAQRIGGDAGDRHIHRRAGGPGGKQGRRPFGLQRKHPRAAVEPGGHTGDEPAAADTDQHGIGQAALMLQLARERAGASHHFGQVVGMGGQRARFALARLAGRQRLGIAGAGHHHARAALGQQRAFGG